MTSRQRRALTVVLALAWLLLAYAWAFGVPFARPLTAGSISADQGFAYSAEIKPPRPEFALIRNADRFDAPRTSRARLYEGGALLPDANSLHSVIRTRGRGTYSDWSNGYLIFSSSDNSDPRTNGRVYELRDLAQLSSDVFALASTMVLAGLLLLWAGPLSATSRSRLASARGAGTLPWSTPDGRRRLIGTFAVTVSAIGAGVAVAFLFGAPFWIAASATVVLGLLAAQMAMTLARDAFGVDWRSSWPVNLALVLGSVGLCIAAFEGYLGWLERSALQTPALGSSGVAAPGIPLPAGFALPVDVVAELKRRRGLLSLPSEWKFKEVAVPNAAFAYSWHGVLHVFDDHYFRRLNGPFPERRADVLRVMVVGDSMTYGAGIRPEWTYSAQLARRMQEEYRIETINLGVNGAQSEDIKQTVRKMLPILRPDLVIYGVCHNDFLPSGMGAYERGYSFPIPEWLKQFLLARTRVAGLVKDGYNRVLLTAGVNLDFHDDILKDFEGYQRRFATDVAEMNQFVRSSGLPPVIAMPLDPLVERGGRGHRISRVAERLLANAGLEVVSLEDYYRQYDGRLFVVSLWESHPNEEANAIFAAMLFEHLRNRADVQRFRRAGAAKSPTN